MSESVRSILKRSETVAGAVRDCRKILAASVRAAERRAPSSIAKRYFASTRIRKLQIGAGPYALKGWLSTDIFPQSKDTMYLDATKPLPFARETFDYIYSEHMIEHVSWRDGFSMLKECHRVLKPGGTLRIATPDLAVMIGLYSQQDAMTQRYIVWITDRLLMDPHARRAAFAINCAFHGWGHQFLYDAETMELTMHLAGFASVKRCPYGQSGDPHLVGIESHGTELEKREMAKFETMILEAQRGPGPQLETVSNERCVPR